MKNLFLFSTFLFSSVCFSISIAAQEVRQNQVMPKAVSEQSKSIAKGAITVQVAADDDQALDDVQIVLFPVATGGNQTFGVTLETPIRLTENRFRFDNLKPGLYRIAASLPGYVKQEEAAGSDSYPIGSEVSIHLSRGGVITGTISDADGALLVETSVRVIRVRDAQGQKLSFQSGLRSPASTMFAFNGWTNDQGVYRIYGLPPGSYLVRVGGQQNIGFSGRVDPAEGLPTYYPSDPLDTAKEVSVNYNQEAGGIDIRHRGEAGRTISGTILSPIKMTSGLNAFFNVLLRRAETGLVETNAQVRDENDRFAFKLEQISAGDYLIQATQRDEKGWTASSVPQKITVKNADIENLEIRIEPPASITGKWLFSSNPALKKQPECTIKNAFMPAETEIALRLDGKEELTETSGFVSNSKVLASEDGEFAFRGLNAGSYRLTPELQNEDLFVVSIKDGSGKTDFGREKVNLPAGTDLRGLTVAVSTGAARLSGKVLTENLDAANSPEKFLVHLIPAEKESADNVLRYAEVMTGSEYKFVFRSLAPGDYFLVAELFQNNQDQPLTLRKPLAWSSTNRQNLRLRAEAQPLKIQLAACQKLDNQTVQPAPKN